MGNVFNPDFQDFIKALHAAEVKYILVGGYAVILHGYNRTTGDLDIWVDRTEENYKRLVRAFQIFGMPVFDMTQTNFLHSTEFDVFTFGVPPVSIDIMVEVKGLTFEKAYPLSSMRVIEGVEIRLIDIHSLLAAKIKAGRHKDLDDIEHIKQG
jgi:predicted nucleotidyltransferase